METPKRTNYILVDFENTQAIDLALIKNKPVVVILLIGEKQKHLPVTLVRQLLEFPDKVRLIESAGSGKNALDFILACQVGQLSQQDPAGFYHIVSKDKGFDPLVAHLKQQKIFAARHDAFAQIPLFVDQRTVSSNDKIQLLTEYFTKHAKNRPAKRTSLIAYINAVFAKQLPESEVLGLVQVLEQRKLITFNNHDKVSYCL
ncbi:PIN domain-containing protein [Thiothrix nivea]|uniref:PIN-like domain-containing protein n=1 Tax=Thiothrix nivea (strain ATCC 35100 / DSM 5205 / JP2) TaxID=870187 RepID=A0A656H8Y6_THINJ|nr:PIN domain-containing protein [Thiothrix nivea]EIJ33191.1 hypothetical protein Thini_0553 [Thiothrix nivea DSM 5205]